MAWERLARSCPPDAAERICVGSLEALDFQGNIGILVFQCILRGGRGARFDGRMRAPRGHAVQWNLPHCKAISLAPWYGYCVPG
jgi:hypothetical protein